MTWEETITYIRQRPEFSKLVEYGYFEPDLNLNVQRFMDSEEFLETLKYIQQYAPHAVKILDIGSGNGISAISFAFKGFDVSALEPDPSNIIGAGAIRQLISEKKLGNVKVFEAYAEKMPFEDQSYDLVYIRQAMHHAAELSNFLKEASRVLKTNGILMTTRDHVIYDQKDKEWFLESHDLHKYYGGENAYTATSYKKAMEDAGLQILKEFKYFDSVINYYPMSAEQVKNLPHWIKSQRKISLRKKIGFLSNIPGLQWLYGVLLDRRDGKILDERKIPGRMYSYICIRK